MGAIATGFEYAGPHGQQFSKLRAPEKFFAVVFTGLQYLGFAVTLPIAFVWSVATFLPQFALCLICKLLGQPQWLRCTIGVLLALALPAIPLLLWKFGNDVPDWLPFFISPAATVTGFWSES
jgi:hypothetical protein